MDWLAFIKTEENEALKLLYEEHRNYCISLLIKQHTLDYIDAIDIFQHSVCILYDNVVCGKLTTLSSSIQSYLFGICRNQAREFKRKQSKFFFSESEHSNGLEIPSDGIELKEELFHAMYKGLKDLGDPCKTLLEHFYFRGWSMKKISENMGYSGVDSTKNQKYKCLKRLQKLALSHISIDTPNE